MSKSRRERSSGTKADLADLADLGIDLPESPNVSLGELSDVPDEPPDDVAVGVDADPAAAEDVNGTADSEMGWTEIDPHRACPWCSRSAAEHTAPCPDGALALVPEGWARDVLTRLLAEHDTALDHLREVGPDAGVEALSDLANEVADGFSDLALVVDQVSNILDGRQPLDYGEGEEPEADEDVHPIAGEILQMARALGVAFHQIRHYEQMQVNHQPCPLCTQRTTATCVLCDGGGVVRVAGAT